jgi:hypothetical protein
VVAQRRSENAQKVPISIATMSAEQANYTAFATAISPAPPATFGVRFTIHFDR